MCEFTLIRVTGATVGSGTVGTLCLTAIDADLIGMRETPPVKTT